MSQTLIKRNLGLFLKLQTSAPFLPKGSEQRAVEKTTGMPHSQNPVNIDLTSGDIDITLRDDIFNVLSTKGFCHGMAICHGIMEAIGKREWWEACLKLVAHWDGNPNNLDEVIQLPNTNQLATRREILTRVVNYIIAAQFSQTTALQPFYLKGGNQENWYKGDQLPLMNDMGVQFHQETTTVGPYKEDDEQSLSSILSEDILKDSLVLIHSDEHVIRAGFSKGQWTLYNASHNHKLSADKSIQKSFRSKADFLNEIYQSLGTITKIQAVSLVPRQNFEFPSLPLNKKHITPDNIYLIVKYEPKKLTRILIESQTNTDIRASLKDAITRLNSEGTSSLYDILMYNTPMLTGLTGLAQNQDFRQALIDRLRFKNPPSKSYGSALEVALHFSGSSELQSLIDIRDKELNKSMLTTLEHSSNIKLHSFIDKHDPTTLQNFFCSIASDPNNISNLLKILTSKNENDVSSWQLLHKKCPKVREHLLNQLVRSIGKLDERDLYSLALELSVAPSNLGDFAELCRERSPTLRSAEFGKTYSWQTLMKACQTCLEKVKPDKDWESYDKIMKLKTERSGFFSLFDRTPKVILENPNDIEPSPPK
ncbi:Uncharacterised protein [Legionella steigerwaltii]|uniref:Uncharacterized protein n=1 Tax=Legionella steigerwaltii TaxID=460 RepID=A0A378LCC8_9GAMM|nr:hypothetical protein [Legionella steigerwaltii]KTD71524.1 hypothetical protein Lstg_2933 [Legionella steigerwaltii]STY23552.1 Uncharacterised protein [Legionella steigerwaltii]